MGSCNGAAKGSAGGQHLLDSLCRGLGWPIDERLGDGDALLHFNDPVAPDGIRKLLVTTGTRVGVVSVRSIARFAPRDLPEHLGFYLLMRNKDSHYGKWELFDSNGEVGFALAYTVPLAALDTNLFSCICQALVKEAHETDAGLRKKGVI